MDEDLAVVQQELDAVEQRARKAEDASAQLQADMNALRSENEKSRGCIYCREKKVESELDRRGKQQRGGDGS